MVNKTQFYKTKVAMAVVLSLGLAACGDSDGDQSTATTTSESTVEAPDNTLEQAQGKGSVQGTVLDTNGLPVMGAKVSLAGQTMDTDASGYYHFLDVPVTGVTGGNAAQAAAPLTVTITGPDDYASATVLVTPVNIVLDSGNNGSNENSNQTEAGAEQTTWFDGFLAQASTANLPKFSATVTGVLRDCNTGAALPAGVKVALDFTNLTATAATNTNTGAPNDNDVTIGVPTFTAMTGAAGVFTFAGLPTDSDLDLTVEGYTADTTPTSSVEAQTLNINTVNEGVVNNIGDKNVCMITSSDSVAPYISSVDSVIKDNTDDGYKWQVLSKGKDGTEGIVLRFNEALDKDAIDTDSLIVTSQVSFSNAAAGEKVETVASAVVADDGLSMTITLAAALPEMTKFSVWMPRYQYQDTSSNRIITGEHDGTEFDDGNATDELVFDVAGTSTGAVAAVAASHEYAINVSTSVNFTAVAAGLAGNNLTIAITDAGTGNPTVVTLTATGVSVAIDITNEDASDLVTAITGDVGASALITATLAGTGTTSITTLANTALTGGDDAKAEIAAGATGSSAKGVSSDTINDTQFKTEYVRTRLCTFVKPITDPGTIDGEQRVITTVAADDTIDAVGVFWDNSGSSTISNLNGQHDATEDLLQELWNRKNPNRASTVADVDDREFIVDNTAVIDGNLNDATSIISSKGTPSTAAGKWKVVVPSAKHGDKVVVTPTAAFNIIGTPITITLEDKVAPTTVIQDSYNYADSFNDQHVNSVAADAGFANGGELSQIGTSGSEGSPILYVTPRLFAKDEANDDDANFNNRADVFRTLAEGNTLNTATTPVPHVTSNRHFVYDVNAIANWAPVSATVGVAFSENINLVTGQAVEFSVASAAPSTTLTGFVANNSQRNEDYIADDTDQDGYHTYLTHGLVQMTSNDIVGLANLDHNGVLDYTAAVSDTVNANAALSDALVVIADAIPPLVTRAELDATTLVVTFNEPVVAGTSSIVISNPDSADLDAPVSLLLSTATSNADNTVWTWSSATSTLPSRALFSSTTTGTAFNGQLDGVATFNGAAEDETVSGNFAYAETATGPVLNHSLLTWANVNDARGNNWAEYRSFYVDSTTDATAVIDTQNDTDSSTNEWRLALRDVPVYLATDTIAAFEVGVTIAVTHVNRATPAIDDGFSVTLTSSHPLNVDTDQWGGDDVKLAGFSTAEITNNFRIVDTASDSTACPANTVAVDLNDDGDTTDVGTDLCSVVMTAVSATWNGDDTELVLTFEQSADLIRQASTWEFQKITEATSTDWTPNDRIGHVVSTILDTNSDEQSQNVKRGF